jgi:Na+/H+ antiporter NhaD/arsenite permease-like protein
MDAMQWLALAVFGITILVVISNKIDNTLAALIGVGVMVWVGLMTEVDAFNYVDWNVMAILVSIWTIAGYFGKTGVPSWLAVKCLRLAGGRPGVVVCLVAFLSGII